MTTDTAKLPSNIQSNRDLDLWVEIGDDGKVGIATGKVEIGQGIKTAIAMIAAEELDVEIGRIEVRTAHTELAPDESITAGSLSIEDSGAAVRVAAATARQLLLVKARDKLKVDFETLRVEDGVISSVETNRVTDYWQLHGGKPFEHRMEQMPPLKPRDHYHLVGRETTRIDLQAKLSGRPAFIQDLTPPDLVHARVVRPPVPGSVLKSLAADDLELPGLIKIIRNGSFVAVIAQREEQVIGATTRLAACCRWSAPDLLHENDVTGELRSHVSTSLWVVDGTPVDSPPPPKTSAPEAVTTLKATYTRPFQMHGSLGPSAAVARYEDGKLTVFTHSQWVGCLKLCLADVLPVASANITVIHAENAGCYGHNGADDAAFDAALLAMELPGHSIMLKWTREEEHRYEPYAPAMLIDMEADLDSVGRVINWCHDVYSYSQNGRPTPIPGESKLLSAQYLDPPVPVPARQPNGGTHSGSHRNADPLYQFPRKSMS